MRALFTTLPYPGHFHPLVPIARAVQDAGHHVAFATAAGFAPFVERCGFACFAAGLELSSPAVAALRAQARSLPGRERATFTAQHIFAGARAERMAADLLALCGRWSPDVVIRETSEYGACVAAEKLGLPHAAVQVTASRLEPAPVVGPPLNRLRAAHGLPDDPGLAMLHRHLVLSPFPPGYRDPGESYPATVRVIRPVPFDRSGTERLPAWVARLPHQPTVYLTLGTAYNDRVAIFSSFIEGLGDEPLNLIVTVGRDQDPSGFGPLPPNVHVERYIPQSQLLPRCDLVVTHGGSGTVIGALVHGLPLVVVPMSNDQSGNAARCAALGVGHAVPWAAMTAATARAAVLRVLRDTSYRRNAEQLRKEIGMLPAPAHAVALLERLAVTRTLAA